MAQLLPKNALDNVNDSCHSFSRGEGVPNCSAQPCLPRRLVASKSGKDGSLAKAGRRSLTKTEALAKAAPADALCGGRGSLTIEFDGGREGMAKPGKAAFPGAG